MYAISLCVYSVHCILCHFTYTMYTYTMYSILSECVLLKRNFVSVITSHKRSIFVPRPSILFYSYWTSVVPIPLHKNVTYRDSIFKRSCVVAIEICREYNDHWNSWHGRLFLPERTIGSSSPVLRRISGILCRKLVCRT